MPLQASILLVEDVPINQQLAMAMLEGIGVTVELAENGQQAVDKVASGDYDLVLMDCQMPVLDGYQATAAIRGLAGGRGSRLPIIALTANAMQGDEEKCLAAGMNDFLAKPFALEQLQAVLRRWLSPAPVARDAPRAEESVGA